MGQKVHPYGFRLGFNRAWKSRWFDEKRYAAFLAEDLNLRDRLKKQLFHAGISDIEIERAGEHKLKVTLHTARPGIIIGRKGSEIDRLREQLKRETGRDVFINIREVDKPELDAQLVAEGIAGALQRRVAFRRAMRKAVESAQRFGAKGIKLRCSGRLGGHEIARDEWYLVGQLPLHTLRADIDYGYALARTTYGVIGVKCWIYKGESTDTSAAPERGRTR